MIRLLLLTLLAFHPLSAQVVTADNCVHQAGDNPKWARPDFDDSQWSKQFPANGSPYVWTRCRIDLSPLPRIAPLLIGVLNQDPWELFVNGVPAGSSRIVFAEHGTSSFEQRGIPSAAGAGPTMTLALRQRLGRRSSRSLSRMLVAGTNDSLAGLSLKAANAYLWESGPSFLGGAILCTIGFLLLLLFCYAKDSRQMELLWFSMVSLSIGSIRIVEFVRGVPNNIPDLYFTLLVVMANVANGFAYPRIFFALAGKRLPRFYYWVSMGVIGLFALFGISALLSFTQRLSGLVPSLNVFLLLLASAAVAAFWPPWQIPRPLRLASILCLLLMFGNSARQLILLLFPSSSSWVTAATNIQSVFMLVSLCGLFVVIAQRHRQVALDRAELQGEMKSAQEVQRLLTSSTLDVAPWAAVEVAYLPAKEVGGDFYFSRQTSEGQLIVVGDVSGKGLRAAMLASVALGAIRNSSTWSPGPLLQSLNSALHGQTGGGFVTCCAVLVRSDGRLSVANAGHPSPYVDGQEFPVEAGLPLGIMPDVAYQESTGHGESITLVSDGVVEAENSQRELFGFDRTREISGKSASEIADAAKAWGQTDDITVVTVRRKT